ncbi:hypothetical protein RPMA_16685 [Tardiphaga alba]|uniref:Uncharacterized protein n=1 Tax=Tardiphaga alba TaxID=340268 RepID=A0ABX8A958_9BRAD|nr:hypothetical protein [Tardiphaga alba]QUS40289.1 hypothetical protein RPMA_16685 [Tardiphaga alba]
MSWQEERDRLLADTLAFVQSVAALAPADIPVQQAAPMRSTPRLSDADIHAQMQKRLEAFRNRQRFLEIERETHFQMAMQRIRAVTEQWA